MNIVESIKETLEIEAKTLINQINNIGHEFEEVVDLILKTSGKVVVIGMGKSGHIGKKIAATFSSTGTPSFFLHPAEAFHGDLGMIEKCDIILAISFSGETDEVLKIIPSLRGTKNHLISITGNSQSTLARNSDIHLFIQVENEACPLSLAPTSSTTLTLAIGDALAIALMRQRKFKEQDFARFHPGGSLGKKLLSNVENKMIKNDLPVIDFNSTFSNVVNSINRGRLGIVLVSKKQKIVGVITDGDLRRVMDKYGKTSWDLCAHQFVTLNPKCIKYDSSLHLAEEMMNEFKITSLLVQRDENEIIGILSRYSL